jgi:hypothetical protein
VPGPPNEAFGLREGENGSGSRGGGDSGRGEKPRSEATSTGQPERRADEQLHSDEHRATGAASSGATLRGTEPPACRGPRAARHRPRPRGHPNCTRGPFGSEAPSNEDTGNRVSVNGARTLVRATGAGSSFGNGGRFADKTGSGRQRDRATGDRAQFQRSMLRRRALARFSSRHRRFGVSFPGGQGLGREALVSRTHPRDVSAEPRRQSLVTFLRSGCRHPNRRVVRSSRFRVASTLAALGPSPSRRRDGWGLGFAGASASGWALAPLRCRFGASGFRRVASTIEVWRFWNLGVAASALWRFHFTVSALPLRL